MRGEGSYKIVKVVAAAQSPRHIPYLVYVIVAGPKGGKYLLDLFNIEMIIRNKITSKIDAFYSIESILLSYARRIGIYTEVREQDTSDKALMDVAKQLNAKPIIRKGQRTSYYTLLNKLDISGLIERR